MSASSMQVTILRDGAIWVILSSELRDVDMK